MVIKADHERIKTLLKDTITLLCRNGLSFKTEFSVEALIGITLDKEDVVLVSINEIIRSELGAKLAMAKAAEEKATERSEEHGDSGESPPCTPASTTNGRQYRKRKHSAGHGSQPNSPEDSHHSEGMDSEDRSYRKTSAGGMLGEESGSEPLNKKGIGESKLHPVKVKEDDTKDVVYIKEEIDTGDWPGGTQTQDSYSDANIQSAGTSNTQNDDNFDFLQSGSLVPVSSDSGPHQSWPDLMQSQTTPSGVNISQSKLSSTMTGTVSGSQSDHSQQMSPFSLSFVSNSAVSLGRQRRAGFQCPQCYKVLRTQQGLHYHLDLHRGIYRYKCTYCSKGFSSLTTYRGHVNVYHRDRQEEMGAVSRYKCPYANCDKSYPYMQSLRSHISNVHPGFDMASASHRSSYPSSPTADQQADPDNSCCSDSMDGCSDDARQGGGASYGGTDLSCHSGSYGGLAFPGRGDRTSEPRNPESRGSPIADVQTYSTERRKGLEENSSVLADGNS